MLLGSLYCPVISLSGFISVNYPSTEGNAVLFVDLC